MSDTPVLTVSQVMNTRIITIDSMAPVRDAIAEMQREGVSSLIVERRNEHDEFGLIVVADIARRVIAANRSPDRVYVHEIMSKPVLSVAPEMAVKYAVRLLDRFGLSRALVVDARRVPVGIVTLRDMVLHHAKGNGL